MNPAVAIVIRPATSCDYPAYARLYAELEGESILAMPAEWERLHLFQFMSLIAETDDGVIGFVMLDRTSGHICHLVVDSDWRHHGVGTRLMKAAAHSLRTHGHRTWTINVKASNQPAVRLYEQFGFQRRSIEHELRVPWSAAARMHRPADARRVLSRIEEWPSGHERLLAPCLNLPVDAGDIPLLLLDRANKVLGTCVFSPARSLCLHLHVVRDVAMTPLLSEMAAHRDPEARAVLVRVGDGPLSRTLCGAGARPVLSVLHMRGRIPAVAAT